MKRIILLAIMLCTLWSTKAQVLPPSGLPCITLIMGESSGHAQLFFNNTVVWVEETPGDFVKVDQTHWENPNPTAGYVNNSLNPSNDTVRVYGKITELDCSYSGIEGIYVANNDSLKVLHCSSCPFLTSLNFHNANALKELYCSGGAFTEIDVTVPNLKKMICSGNNNLVSLSVDHCPALEDLNCSVTELGTLDISNHPSLKKLTCIDAALTSLNVENAAALEQIICKTNPLPVLDVSSVKTLCALDCSRTRLTALDLSENPALSFLNCSGSMSKIKSLNVANGNNVNFGPYGTYTSYAFASTANNVPYIQIDEGFTPPTSGNKRWYKDKWSTWQQVPFTGIDDLEEGFKLKVWSDAKQISIRNLKENQTVKIVDLSGKVMGNYFVTGASVDLPASPGLYIVQIADEKFKVVVK